MRSPCTLFTNPLSGGYSPRKVGEALSALNSHGFEPSIEELRTPDEAALCARRLCRDQTNPFIIVAGGDGTINGVINGLVPGAATLAVLPFGTSNVLSRELGIESPSHALEKIIAGVSRPASVGYMEKGESGRHFILMAGIGVDGSVVKGVRTSEKRMFRKGAYLLSAFRLLLSWETEFLEVVSGTTGVKCHSVIVCNASKYGGNRIIAPEASLFEPGFRVVCIRDGTRRGILKAAFSLMSGKGARGAGIRSFTAREVEIRGVKPLQADGDYYFDTPVRIRAVPDFVRIIT